MKIADRCLRWMIGLLSGVGLTVMYLFLQHADVASAIGVQTMSLKFMINKTFRFLANDFFMIGLLWALFDERKYVIFSLWVQAAGFIFFLIPYFVLKLSFHSGDGPLVSFLHRLILNPTLLILLIPAFYYQRLKMR